MTVVFFLDDLAVEDPLFVAPFLDVIVFLLEVLEYYDLPYNSVELGRRPKYYNGERHIDIPNDYLYVTSSNNIEAPNDHVLFDKNVKTVYFKDVKTNIITEKDVTSIAFLRNIGRIYNLYDLQSDFNKNSWIDSEHLQLDLRNPSSSNPSSTFKK